MRRIRFGRKLLLSIEYVCRGRTAVHAREIHFQVIDYLILSLFRPGYLIIQLRHLLYSSATSATSAICVDLVRINPLVFGWRSGTSDPY